ncbi:Uncharacterized protein dnm_007990 [Desulfonema magnum]|uniref:Uncharacterized protein n=1 Tax=Desulfonema magnum TaxID=45655 RepID=A0A975BFI7_9BACT|nr:Uncharacterized protein dnm_007990 [Desulfonema magnum]
MQIQNRHNEKNIHQFFNNKDRTDSYENDCTLFYFFVKKQRFKKLTRDPYLQHHSQ